MSTFNLKLAKPAPVFYEEPRPEGVGKVDRLLAYRDRTHSRDSAFFTPSDAEQIQANVANANNVP